MTLGEWLEVWLAECAKPSVRPSTFEGYRAYVRDKIVPYLGDKEIRKVTAGDVQKLYRKLKRRAGPLVVRWRAPRCGGSTAFCIRQWMWRWTAISS